MNKIEIQEFVFEDFTSEAPEIIEEPVIVENQNKSETVIDTKAIYNEGYQKGFKDGKQEGLTIMTQQCGDQKNQIRQELTVSFKETLEKALLEINQNFRENRDKISQLENEIVSISIEIAQKIIEKELENKSVFENLIKKSLTFAKSDKIKLRLNANDAQNLSETFDNIEIIPDENLAPGSIIIEEESSLIDASIKTKLEELKRSLINDSK